ncbi:hypothetical protein D3C81_1196140 [compost metagenome]
MLSVPERTSATMRTRLALMSAMACISWPTSSFEVARTCTLRSPSAMVRATPMASASEAAMRRASSRPMLATSAVTARDRAMAIQRALAAAAAPSAAPLAARFAL